MNAINLELLKVFYYVAKHGSISSAANFLKHPKSKLSKDIKKLEEELKTQLLVRSPRWISLTEKGFSLLRETQSPLEILIESPNLIFKDQDELEGVVKITSPEDIAEKALIPFVNNFQILYPKVKVELYLSTDIINFSQSDIDLAIRIGKLKDSSLKQQKVGDVFVNYYATKEYMKSRPKINTIHDLSDHQIAVIKTSAGELMSKFAFNKSSIRIASNSMLSLKQLTLYGNHIVTLPSFYIQDEMKESKIINVLPSTYFFKGTVYLLSRPTRHTPSHIREFKAQLLTHLRKTLKIE